MERREEREALPICETPRAENIIIILNMIVLESHSMISYYTAKQLFASTNAMTMFTKYRLVTGFRDVPLYIFDFQVIDFGICRIIRMESLNIKPACRLI